MALSSGIYSLFGVVVGGGITWGTQWGLATRSDRLDTRVGRRKIGAELLRQRQAIARSASARVTNYEELNALFYELAPASEAWDKHSDRLARHLSDPDWDAVELAYGSVFELNAAIHDEDRPPGDDEVARALERIDDALRRLR